jgi:acid phosphatase
LDNNLSAYVTWAQTHNSLLIVTWDEDDGSEGNQVATIFVGPMVNPGQYNEDINHYNVLRTIEAMYGLKALGNSATAKPVKDVWQ